MRQSNAIANYIEATETMEAKNADYEAMKKAAQKYNKELLEKENRWCFDEEDQHEYEQLLNVAGDGILGHISIPKIEVSLPIYHGTDESVLQKGAGHLAGSSLPVGGAGTHCVLSAHRGLPSSKLFTDLDQMEVRDIFILQVLDETLIYEVDQIKVVKPEEMEYLAINEEKDYCTLLTCTPYGINTHRLLVRGHRVKNVTHLSEEEIASSLLPNPS